MNVADTPDLLEEARRGDNEACARLIEENGGLIWSIVRRYYGRGVEPEDLYQLGCLGFVKAVRGFDPAFVSSPPMPYPRSPVRSGATYGMTALLKSAAV